MAYLKVEDAVEEYQKLTTKLFSAWRISTVHKFNENGVEITDKNSREPVAKVEYSEGAFRENDLKRMLKDPEYYNQSYDRLMYEIKLGRQLMKQGFDNGYPWFGTKPKGHKSSKKRISKYGAITSEGEWEKEGAGLAAMRPEEKQDENGALYTAYKLPDAKTDNYEKPWVKVTNNEVSLKGGLTEEQIAEKNIFTATARLVRAYTADYTNARLAQQQLSIQKWGDFKLSGSDRAIDKSIDVAVKYGTWQHIANAELQGVIAERVRNESGADAIWERMSGAPLRGNISGIELNNTLFDAHDVLVSTLQKARDHGGLKNLDKKQDEHFQALIDKLKEFKSESKGDFLNQIIAKSRDADSLSYADLLGQAHDIIRKNPELKARIENEINERAAMRGVVDPSHVKHIQHVQQTAGESGGQTAPKPVPPALAISGFDSKNSVYDAQEAMNQISADSLPPEVRKMFENTRDQIQDLAKSMDGDETQAMQKLAKANLADPTISMRLKSLGIMSVSQAPDFANPDDNAAKIRERYISQSAIGNYANLDMTTLQPEGSDNSYLVSKATIAAGGASPDFPDGKNMDILVITQSGDDNPVAIVYHDDARNRDVFVGCAAHPGAEDTNLAQVADSMGHFKRILSTEQKESLNEFRPFQPAPETPAQQMAQGMDNAMKAAEPAMGAEPKPEKPGISLSQEDQEAIRQRQREIEKGGSPAMKA